MNAGDFEFDLATPADDAAIRRLLADNPVPGDVTLTYRREPSYFAGCPVMGDTQILVARHRPTGRLAGLATRSIRTHFSPGFAPGIGSWNRHISSSHSCTLGLAASRAAFFSTG